MMIKNVVIGLIVMVSVFLNINNVWAQSPTVPPVAIENLPMIRSQDCLRQYALGIARMGSRHAQSQSMDWNWEGNRSSLKVVGDYGEDILNRLFSKELIYMLANPDDLIMGYAYLYDDSENLLFFGMAEYTADQNPEYQIWMQNIPLPLKGVQSAEVLITDDDGKTARREWLQVNSRGQIMFPPWMAGAPNGTLVVRGENGTLVTYQLSNPVGSVPGSNGEVATFKVDGHYIFTSNQKGGLPVIKITEMWTLPSVFLEVNAGEIFTFDVMGLVQADGKTYWERPTEWVFERIDGKVSGSGPILPNGTTQSFLPDAGKYRIRFLWKNFGKPNKIYTGPMEGGKG